MMQLTSQQKVERLGFKVRVLNSFKSDWSPFCYSTRVEVICPCGSIKIFTVSCKQPIDFNNEKDRRYLYDLLYFNEFNEDHMKKDGWSEEAIQCVLNKEINDGL